MTRLFSSTAVNLTHLQMLPSQPQPTAKRKALDDSNPLLAAAKRAKKENKTGPSTKRKLMNAEETPGGLLIVRASESMPHSQNTAHTKPSSRVASQPPPSNPSSTLGAGPSKPPSKKFRAGSQPPPAARSSTLPTLHDDPQLEQDVRAMEDEADHLRRNSRAHTTIDPAFNPAFQFPPRAESSTTKGKSRIVDTSILIPERETPKIERNKQLREGAMAAIANGRSSRPLEQNGKGQGHHRRKSSVSGRGKRISTSFETTGVIVQPHNSVADTSFYKHIDCDLPEVERIRTLLIWCSLRAAGISGSNGTSSSKSKPRPSSTQPPPPPLPPLSDKAAQLLMTAQEGYIRMLAEKRIDLSLFPQQAAKDSTTEVLRDNEQNVRNRLCEVIYSENIQKAQAEDEAWKKVSYDYEAYTKKLQTSLDKRNAANTATTGEPSTPSAKAKGKRRATTDTEISALPREHELSSEFQRSSSLARSVLGLRDQDLGDDRIACPSSSRRPGTQTREELESELDRRLPLLQFKVDQLYTWANAAKRTVDIGEMSLNERFEVLNANLDAKLHPRVLSSRSGSGQGSGANVLGSYVRPSSSAVPGGTVAPLELLRALGRVDKERPLALVGDEARRAAREVQRREESGIGAVGDRRLTVTVIPATPRKPPGTPRRDKERERGGTPGRERSRSRTPGRER